MEDLVKVILKLVTQNSPQRLLRAVFYYDGIYFFSLK